MKSGELQRRLDTINAHGADLHMAYNKLCETPAHLIDQRQNAYSRINGQA